MPWLDGRREEHRRRDRESPGGAAASTARSKAGRRPSWAGSWRCH